MEDRTKEESGAVRLNGATVAKDVVMHTVRKDGMFINHGNVSEGHPKDEGWNADDLRLELYHKSQDSFVRAISTCIAVLLNNKVGVISRMSSLGILSDLIIARAIESFSSLDLEASDVLGGTADVSVIGGVTRECSRGIDWIRRLASADKESSRDDLIKMMKEIRGYVCIKLKTTIPGFTDEHKKEIEAA